MLLYFTGLSLIYLKHSIRQGAASTTEHELNMFNMVKKKKSKKRSVYQSLQQIKPSQYIKQNSWGQCGVHWHLVLCMHPVVFFFCVHAIKAENRGVFMTDCMVYCLKQHQCFIASSPVSACCRFIDKWGTMMSLPVNGVYSFTCYQCWCGSRSLQ